MNEHFPMGSLSVRPEMTKDWSVSDWMTVGGLVLTGLGWIKRKVILNFAKFVVDAVRAPGRIDNINKKISVMESSIALSMSLSRTVWRCIDRPIWQTDADGLFIHVNPFMLRLLCRNDDELLGDNWRSAVHEDDREMVMREWDNSIKHRREFNMTYRWVSATGEPIRVHAQTFRLYDSDNNVTLGWTGIATLLDT